MPAEMNALIRSAEWMLAAQDAEHRARAARERAAVYVRHASGTGHMAEKLGLETDYRLVFVRCHFAGSAGTAPLVISVSSRLGADHDVVVRSLTAGMGADVFEGSFAARHDDPSPWAFAPGDELVFSWTNPVPGGIKWGLEVGLALSARPGAGA